MGCKRPDLTTYELPTITGRHAPRYLHALWRSPLWQPGMRRANSPTDSAEVCRVADSFQSTRTRICPYTGEDISGDVSPVADRSDNDGPAEKRCYVLQPSPLSVPVRPGRRRLEKSRADGGEFSSGDAVHVRFQDSASWLTPSGVSKKRKMLERLGLPDMAGRRFITLSLDRRLFGRCPLSGYLAGKERMRRFLELGRKAGLWKRGCWWAWKLEFQRDGWAHWHIILDRTKKISYEEMRKIEEIWALGRTNCRRISKSQFGYQFKYAFKGVYQEGEETGGLCVPSWFLNYYERGSGEVKPKSFARVRFWQTSKGFYDKSRSVEPSTKEQQTCLLPRPVSQVLHDSARAVLVVSRFRSGRYKSSKRLLLGVDYEYFIRVHLWDAEHGAGCTLSARSFIMDPQTITKLIEKTDICKLPPLLKNNHLTLKRAMFLRQSRVSLETF